LQIERTYRGVLDPAGDPVELHLVMDNYAAHKHTAVKAWLTENPRFIVHFTPTHAGCVKFQSTEGWCKRRGVSEEGGPGLWAAYAAGTKACRAVNRAQNCARCTRSGTTSCSRVRGRK